MEGSSLQTVFPIRVPWTPYVPPPEPPLSDLVMWLDFTDPDYYTVNGSNVPTQIINRADDVPFTPTSVIQTVIDAEGLVATTNVSIGGLTLNVLAANLPVGTPYVFAASVWTQNLGSDSLTRLAYASNPKFLLSYTSGPCRMFSENGTALTYTMVNEQWNTLIIKRSVDGTCEIYVDGSLAASASGCGNPDTRPDIYVRASNVSGHQTKIKSIMLYDVDTVSIASIHEYLAGLVA